MSRRASSSSSNSASGQGRPGTASFWFVVALAGWNLMPVCRHGKRQMLVWQPSWLDYMLAHVLACFSFDAMEHGYKRTSKQQYASLALQALSIVGSPSPPLFACQHASTLFTAGSIQGLPGLVFHKLKLTIMSIKRGFHVLMCLRLTEGLCKTYHVDVAQ